MTTAGAYAFGFLPLLMMLFTLMNMVALSSSESDRRTNCLSSDSGFLSIIPSDVSNTLTIHNNNEPHLVGIPVPERGREGDGVLRVFLPGTGRSPSDYSCLLASLSGSDGSALVIGLSYESWADPDAKRNEFCSASTVPEVARCLACQHERVLFGRCDGDSHDYGTHELWPEISKEASVAGRLGDLLRYLASSSDPKQKWGQEFSEFLDVKGAVRWDRVWILGHSQGAGHATYLAHKVELAGGGLLSGPQDELLLVLSEDAKNATTKTSNTTKWWIDEPFATTNVRAMAHERESATSVIRNNWGRMEPFHGLQWVIIDDGDADAIPPNDQRPWLTRSKPQPNATCTTRPYHCSTARDRNAPFSSTRNSIFVEINVDINDYRKNPYLYAQSVWPRLAGLEPNTISSTDEPFIPAPQMAASVLAAIVMSVMLALGACLHLEQSRPSWLLPLERG